MRSVSIPLIATAVNLLFALGLTGQTSVQAGQIDFELKAKNLAFYKSNGFDTDVQTNGRQGFDRLSMPGPGPLTGELPKEALIFDFTVTSTSAGEQDPWTDADRQFSFAMSFTLTIDVPLATEVTAFDFTFPTFYFTDNVNDIPVNPDWIWVDSQNGQDTWIQMRLSSTSAGSEGYLAYATTDTSAAQEYAATGGDLIDGTTVIEKGVGSISYTAVPEFGGVGFASMGLSILVAGHALRRRSARARHLNR